MVRKTSGHAGGGHLTVEFRSDEFGPEDLRLTLAYGGLHIARQEDISRKIEAIQADVKSAVAAIGSISGVIRQVNDISGTIATALEEQSATSSEMSRNISRRRRVREK
jgi:hypothetical protein